MALTDVEVGMCPATMLADPFQLSREQLAELITASTGSGFRVWSLWTLHAGWVGIENVRPMLADAGITVPVVEAISAWGEGPSAAQRADVRTALEVAVALGANTVAACILAPTVDLARAAEGFAAACDEAAERGIRVCLEFLPWTGVGDLATAWSLVQAAGRPNGGLLLDTWHWVRQPGGPAPELLRSIPGERIHYVQVCDAASTPAGESFNEAMSGRLPPGKGIVDFAEVFEVLDAIEADPIVAAEVFSVPLNSKGPGAVAEAVRSGVDATFGRG